MLASGKLGIHPPGALGVAFYLHANADCFVGRSGSKSIEALHKNGILRYLDGDVMRTIDIQNRVFTNPLDADARGELPELLLLCSTPDQLGEFTQELTNFLENLSSRGHMQSVQNVRDFVPIILVLPNGICTERMISDASDQLNESRLMGRLPNFTSDMANALQNRIVRGVAMQAGGRKGSGDDSIYLMKGKGWIEFAGCAELEAERIEAILSEKDYPFKHHEHVSGVRLEFDKAMISIVLNVGGLIHTVDEDGNILDVRMGDLCADQDSADFVRKITESVFRVGKAIGVYSSEETYESVWATHRDTILKNRGHVTSSLKSFYDSLDRGLESVQLFTNERWILQPLTEYAITSGMAAEERLFNSLKRQVQQAMARAIRHKKEETNSGGGRKQMELIARRDMGVDLFKLNDEDLVVVGTMLDSNHLINLELTIHLPDEQIIASKLDMIRTPFPVCQEVQNSAERLIGLRIERGVMSEITRRIGGHEGCSHVKQIANNIIYFVASYLARKRAGITELSTDSNFTSPEERFNLTKGFLENSCLAYCQSTPRKMDSEIDTNRGSEEHTSMIPLGDYEESLGFLLKNRAETYENKTYIRYRRGDENATISWKAFAHHVFTIANNLIREGVCQGDRVAMLSENRLEMFMFELALMSIGGVTVPIFAGYPEKQVDYILNHSRPKYIVASCKKQFDKVTASSYKNKTTSWVMDEVEQTDANAFSSLLENDEVPTDKLEDRLKLIHGDDLCLIMYTSGTTGPPKGVRLTHRNIISQQKAISLLWDVDEDDTFLCYLPWHHSFGGLFERFMTLFSGATLGIDDSKGRDMDRIVENWRLWEPTIFFSVPRVHEMLLSECKKNDEVDAMVFGDRLRMVFTAGASLPATVEAGYRRHGIPVLEGWGLTETSPCVTVTTMDGTWRSGHVGMPIPGVRVKIDNSQEILVKGPNVMQGYLDDEDATAKCIDRNGWFHTGDLGEFRKDGLRVFGRLDGAFKLTTGEKVHPQRIEITLANESEYISTSLIVGSGQDYVGAIIFPSQQNISTWLKENDLPPDSQLSCIPALRDLFAKELERINAVIDVKYQRPVRAIIADNPLSLERGELTPSGKVVRLSVMGLYEDQVHDMFATNPSERVIRIVKHQMQGT